MKPQERCAECECFNKTPCGHLILRPRVCIVDVIQSRDLKMKSLWSSCETYFVHTHLHNSGVDYTNNMSESYFTAKKGLVWDETLRVVAEAYAAKCIWDHNPQLEELSLGENLFVNTGPFNATKALLNWFQEHVDYDFETNNCPEDKMCGHYTQMVWADSNRIGCATHFCDTLEGLGFKKATLLVCDYYPTGNYEGRKPYESGAPCSKCPDKLSLCEDNICGNVKTLSTEIQHEIK
uniref:SCP domain-containing protein n=1 Tax=Cyprinus carpio TaxID=7962 RepID=A0A8C1KTU6_CYPCA